MFKLNSFGSESCELILLIIIFVLFLKNLVWRLLTDQTVLFHNDNAFLMSQIYKDLRVGY